MRPRAVLLASLLTLSACARLGITGPTASQLRAQLFERTRVGSAPEEAQAVYDAWEYKCGLPFEDRGRNDASGRGPGDSDPRVVRVLSGCVRAYNAGGDTRYWYANWLYDSSNRLVNITISERIELLADPESHAPPTVIHLR